MKETIYAKGMEISIYTDNFQDEYISLTDIAKYKSDEPNDIIRNWLRGKDTIEFLGLWETLHNPEFKPVEFDGFKKQAGLNAFTLSPKRWIETTNAKGIVSKSEPISNHTTKNHEIYQHRIPDKHTIKRGRNR